MLTIPEAANALGIERNKAAAQLASFARRGWLVRARRGLYLVPSLEAEPDRPAVAEDPWIVAWQAFSPCYIGGWSAAEYWGLTEQLFVSTLVVTAAHVRGRSAELLGHEFRLFRVPPERISGRLTSVWRGSERVSVASRERTIVDCVRNPELCGGIRHLAHMMDEYARDDGRDFDALLAEGEGFATGAAWKRLGFLAEILWPDEARVVAEAKRRLTAGNARLDPAVHRRGRLLRRWRLWVNVNVKGQDDS